MDEDPRNYAVKPPGRLFYFGWLGALLLVLIATAGIVLARGLWLSRETSEREQQQAAGRRVLVQPVTHAAAKRQVVVPGDIHGFVETPVYAKIAGYLKTIRVDKGDRVKEGDVLAMLESPELDKQVADAKATYDFAAITDHRNQDLVNAGVIAHQDADQSHAQMLSTQAQYEQLIAMQAYKIITAPFAGVVTARYVDPGVLIPQTTSPSAGGTPIIQLATLSPLRVYAQMPQSAAPFIRDGDAATITVAEHPGRDFNGTVTRHPEALNADTRTMLVEVDLDNHDRALLPGMYAQMGVQVSTGSGAPLVPDDALVFRAGKVFVPIVRDNRLRLIEVSLGYDNGQLIEITKGLAGDELVAMNVGQSARDGEPVQPERVSQSN